NFLGNKLDDSDPSGAAVEVPATTRPLPTWTARPLPTALPTTEVVFPTDTATALPSETPFVPTEVFAPTFVFTRTPRSTDESGPYVLQVSCPHPNRVLKVVFSPDSRQVVIGDEYGNVQIMEVGGCEPIKKLEKHMYSITALAFSPGGSVLASQSGDIYLRDYQNAALVGTLSPGEVSINTTLAFSPDGKFLASSGENLLIWNFETRSLMKTITTGGYASSVAFSPDGQQMASTSYIVGGMEVVLWDTGSWTEIRRLQIDLGVIPQVAFSPDGKWLATSGDHRVQVWNMDDFSLQYESAYESSYALKIAFSPDSSLLAFSSKGLVHVIDFMSKEEMTTLVTHGDINALAFSPDGLWLASANGIFDSPDNYFYVWYVGG
ncbi:MAG: hypothetical protein K8I82_25650, partial [Anaerolineae bacterium]|nr:hypothetical protein [Anaerolineae bacterium]